MRKFLALTLVIFMLVTVLASCSNNPENLDGSSESAGDTSSSDLENGSGDNSTDGGEESVGDEAPYSKSGVNVEMGSYPQKEVLDSDLIDTLNELAGDLPTVLDSMDWTSYEYYSNGSQTDYMWYIDVEEEGSMYRGVYFTSYRPAHISEYSNSDKSEQDNNSYSTETVYWFEFQPILWTVLVEDEEKALIICESIIDAQAYDTSSNSYEGSMIREWLNKDFYETAFNEIQQELILDTTVDNSVASTGSQNNPYSSADTEDKIFLLSRAEVKDSTYGITDNSTRVKAPTDYAVAQGLYKDIGNVGWWWLRSPYNDSYSVSYRIKTDGSIHSIDVGYITGGIVPALWLDLTVAESDSIE